MQGDKQKKITDRIVIDSWEKHADPEYYGVRSHSMMGSSTQAVIDSLTGGSEPTWGRRHPSAGADGIGEDDRCWM